MKKLNLRPNIHVLFALALRFTLILKSNEITASCLINSSQPEQSDRESHVTNLHLTPDFRAVKLGWNYERSYSNNPASFRIRYCELTSWNIEIKCRSKDLLVEVHRQRQKQQQQQQPNQTNVGNFQDGIEHLSVITMTKHNQTVNPTNQVYLLDSPNGSYYETQIYDLRALTNYTFNVKVLRFSHEPASDNVPLSLSRNSNNRDQAGRRLQIGPTNDYSLAPGSESGHHNEFVRIETKPFSAEATKCLADSSEVLVNTGKYFGGRISVEDNLDPRCNIIGNKSSDQSTYLFRIDHEICGSKIIDGNRIESMVLVHENKDILTHNTARFLVLCNFLQKSFTIRASVSLPNVNGISPPNSSRPAVITSLPSKPGMSDLQGARAKSSMHGDPLNGALVMLGSMPGIYRARNTASGQHYDLDLQSEQSAGDKQGQHLRSGVGYRMDANPRRAAEASQSTVSTLDELEIAENNPIEKFLETLNSSTRSGVQGQRQSKELVGGEPAQKAHSLTLSPPLVSTVNDSQTNASKRQLPQSVQVQSKMLFVERSAGRRIGGDQFSGQVPTATDLMVRSSSKIDTAVELTAPLQQVDPPSIPALKTTTPPPTPPTTAATFHNVGHPKSPKQLQVSLASSNYHTNLGNTVGPDLQATPVIMTNNHRVSGGYVPISQVVGTNPHSIKYSAAEVDEYSLDKQQATVGNDEMRPQVVNELPSFVASQNGRARSGRMRSVEHDKVDQMVLVSSLSQILPTLSMAPVTQTATKVGQANSARFKPSVAINRMGDLVGETAAVGDDGIESMTNGSTTTTTTSGDGQVNSERLPMTGANSSLAQNITNYLLKWSLKTLSNLAKKSLETLIQANNSTTSAGEVLDDEGSSTNFSSLTTQSVPAAKLTEVYQRGSFLQNDDNETQDQGLAQEPVLRLRTMTTVTTATTKAPRANHELVLDGFLTNRGGDVQKARPHQATSESPPPRHHSRPANYSKSLDFNRVEPIQTINQHNKQKNSEIRSKPLNIQRGDQHSNLTDDELHQAPTSWSAGDKGASYSSLLLYALVILVALIGGLFLILWLVSPSSPQRSPSFPTRNCGLVRGKAHSVTRVNPIVTYDEFGPQYGVDNGGGGLIHDAVTYQKYDYNKFENYPSDTFVRDKNQTVANSIVGTSHRPLLLQHNPVATKHQQLRHHHNQPTWRPQSAISEGSSTTVMADERDCKNGEFLYADHVRISADCDSGESYA